MALLLAIEHPSTGVVASYWRIAAVHLDAIARRGRVVLAGYINATVAARAGAQPVDQREFDLDTPAFIALAQAAPANAPAMYDVLAIALYNYIKTAPRVTASGQQSSEFASAANA